MKIRRVRKEVSKRGEDNKGGKVREEKRVNIIGIESEVRKGSENKGTGEGNEEKGSDGDKSG